MARDYGRIRSQFWSHAEVKGWSLELKAVASYLMTCEHTTALGAFRLPAVYMSDDLDLSPSQARAYLEDLEGYGFIRVCKASGWIWIVNYLKHNKPEGGNVWKHVRSLAASIPSAVSFRAEVISSIPDSTPTPSKPETDGDEGHSNGVQMPSNEVRTIEPNLSEPIPLEPNPTDKGARASDSKPREPAEPKPQRYPADFEEFWAAYPTPANSSKADAAKAWQKTARERPAEILECVAAFVRWLEAENAKRKPSDPYPVCHPATWLNGKRWETHLEAAQRDAARAAEAEAKRFSGLPACWRPAAEAFAERHGWGLWDATVSTVRLLEGDPPVIEFDRAWSLNNAKERGLLAKLAAALGQDPLVTVKGGKAA